MVIRVCDYCGCRDEGPTAELNAEHDQLHEMTLQLRSVLNDGGDPSALFAEFTHLLGMHAAKEEVGLFPQVRELGKLDEDLDQLVAEHETLHRQLGDGHAGAHVREALTLLGQHIDDEEWGLFPHVIHALDPEQWDEIALAHLAVEQAFAEPSPAEPSDGGGAPTAGAPEA